MIILQKGDLDAEPRNMYERECSMHPSIHSPILVIEVYLTRGLLPVKFRT